MSLLICKLPLLRGVKILMEINWKPTCIHPISEQQIIFQAIGYFTPQNHD